MIKLLLLFILRTNVKYEIFTIIFLTFFGNYNQSQIKSLIPMASLLILLIIYYRFLSQMKYKTYFLYTPRTINRMKKDLIKALMIVSYSATFMLLSIDYLLLYDQFISFEILYSITIFGIISYFLPINIEKNNTSLEIITTKEILIISVITTLLNFIYF